MSKLTKFRVAVLATEGFEESELSKPVATLQSAGADVSIVSLESGEIRGSKKNQEPGAKVKVDCRIQDVSAEDFDAVVLPGGIVNSDSLRMVPEVKTFLTEMQNAGKPFVTICDAPGTLDSVNLVAGRKLTSYTTVQDDLRNAGGIGEDREEALHGNWVTSRQANDLPAFNVAMLEIFAASQRAGHTC